MHKKTPVSQDRRLAHSRGALVNIHLDKRTNLFEQFAVNGGNKTVINLELNHNSLFGRDKYHLKAIYLPMCLVRVCPL